MPKKLKEKQDWPFRGLCISVPKQEDFDVFKRMIVEVLPEHDCNTLVLLTRYKYQFTSHPNVAVKGALSKAQARELAALCKEHGIRLIPKMNLLGHQSGKTRGSLDGLLAAYPEFDETPDLDEVRYCRSLCPRHPEVKKVVFALADELIEAFDADAIHVGADEVFEIGRCPRCKGFPNDELFAEWINALYERFVTKNKLEMLMWGDRLLDAEATGYSEWEASSNGTAGAIDRVPKDILICDWHYGKRDDYPSIGIFTDKGFRMVVCPWKEVENTEALVRFAAANRSDRLLGVLTTTWCDGGAVARYLVEGDAIPPLVGESFRMAMSI